MQNYDEAILRSRRVDPAAPFPVLHQAVRIALYDEYAARSFYQRVAEAYGGRQPFARIARSEAQHIAALSAICDRLGISRPLDPFPEETVIESGWLANCNRAIAGEVANVRLYAGLLEVVRDAGVIRVFRNLQAASYENHLPAFQQAARLAADQERYHQQQGVPAQQAYVRHGPVSDLFEQVLARASGSSGLLGVVSPVLRNAHPALLAGLVIGGGGTWLVREKLKRKSQEK